MLHRTSEMTLATPSRTDRIQERLRLQYERLALSWHAMRLRRGRAVSLKSEGGLVRVDDGVRHIFVPNVRRAGVFKSGINTWLESVAEKYVGSTGYTPREGDTVIDVGAGIGEFSLWSAAAGARVVAFEPDPLAFVCLERNTAPVGTVQIYPYALWKERTNLRLHGSPDTSESSLIEDGRANTRNADVEAWPLDRLQFMTRLPVLDFMKVDGEGVEPEILAGAARTLRRTRVISVDVSATDRRPNLRARVETMLSELGFEAVAHDRSDTIFALNTTMVGPFSSRVLGRRSS
jgi:FkbM family methyltransferase